MAEEGARVLSTSDHRDKTVLRPPRGAERILSMDMALVTPDSVAEVFARVDMWLGRIDILVTCDGGAVLGLAWSVIRGRLAPGAQIILSEIRQALPTHPMGDDHRGLAAAADAERLRRLLPGLNDLDAKVAQVVCAVSGHGEEVKQAAAAEIAEAAAYIAKRRHVETFGTIRLVVL